MDIHNQFEKNLRQIEKLTGMRREEIARTFSILNLRRGRKWEAKLWSHTASKDKLRWWIKECAERGGYDENAFVELASFLPLWAKRSLLELAKALPSLPGGKPKALLFRERLEVLRRFRELTQHSDPQKRLPKYKAYTKIAAEFTTANGKCVHPHTIRIICDHRERERSRMKRGGQSYE